MNILCEKKPVCRQAGNKNEHLKERWFTHHTWDSVMLLRINYFKKRVTIFPDSYNPADQQFSLFFSNEKITSGLIIVLFSCTGSN